MSLSADDTSDTSDTSVGMGINLTAASVVIMYVLEVFSLLFCSHFV